MLHGVPSTFRKQCSLKSLNLQYNAVERRVDETLVPLSDDPMFILIDWE
jgi:hypothetical protein